MFPVLNKTYFILGFLTVFKSDGYDYGTLQKGRLRLWYSHKGAATILAVSKRLKKERLRFKQSHLRAATILTVPERNGYDFSSL